MNPEHYKMAQSFAIEYGTFLGAAWLTAFACFVFVIVSGNLFAMMAGMAVGTLALVMPFYLAWRFKQHLDVGERVSAFVAGCFAFLMFTYASMLAGVGHLVYFTYMDNGQLLNAFHTTLFSPEAEAQYKAIGANDMLLTARDQFDAISQLTPMQIALALFENNIFFSLLFTLPVAFVAHRKAVKVMIPK